MTSFAPLPFGLRQLQYVVAVAEALSFGRAADRCNVSQPSLSAQIAAMEEAIGVRLFERDRRRVLVTEAGRELVARAIVVLREAHDLAQAARRFTDPLSGSLRIGIIPTISPYLLPRAAPAIRKAYPKLTILWTEKKTAAVMRDLDAGALDAAILAVEPDLGDVERDTIARDPFVLVAPVAHPLAKKGARLKVTELRDARVLLLDDEHCFGRQALAVCARAKATDLEFRATSLSTIAQMVAGGVGVTLLPALAVPTEARSPSLAVRRFADPAPARTLGLVWRKRSPFDPALRKLADTIRAIYPAS